jgi:hypothetical protein
MIWAVRHLGKLLYALCSCIKRKDKNGKIRTQEAVVLIRKRSEATACLSSATRGKRSAQEQKQNKTQNTANEQKKNKKAMALRVAGV